MFCSSLVGSRVRDAEVWRFPTRSVKQSLLFETMEISDGYTASVMRCRWRTVARRSLVTRAPQSIVLDFILAGHVSCCDCTISEDLPNDQLGVCRLSLFGLSLQDAKSAPSSTAAHLAPLFPTGEFEHHGEMLFREVVSNRMVQVRSRSASVRSSVRRVSPMTGETVADR